MALQGCGDFANDQVIHLLGGFWIVSAEAKKNRVLLLTIGCAPSSHLKEPKEEEIMSRATWPSQGQDSSVSPQDPGV